MPYEKNFIVTSNFLQKSDANAHCKNEWEFDHSVFFRIFSCSIDSHLSIYFGYSTAFVNEKVIYILVNYFLSCLSYFYIHCNFCTLPDQFLLTFMKQTLCFIFYFFLFYFSTSLYRWLLHQVNLWVWFLFIIFWTL